MMVSFDDMASFASLYEKFDASQAWKLAGLIQQAYDQFDEREKETWVLPNLVCKTIIFF